MAVFILDHIFKDHALVSDLHRRFVILKSYTLQLGIAELMMAGGYFLGDRETGQLPHTLSDRGSGYIHSCIAGANDDHAVSQFIAVRIVQIVDAEVHMAQGLSLDMEGIGLPDAGSHENSLITVTEQIVDTDGSADMCVGAEFNAF